MPGWKQKSGEGPRAKRDKVQVHDLDDLELVRLIQNSELEAFSEFYDRYVNLIYSIAYNILGSQPLAEDVTQDVFLKIWLKIDNYEPNKAKISTWLSSITRNRAIDLARKRNKINRQVSWADAARGQSLDGDSPEERTELNLTRKRVREALAELPEEQRSALALAYFRDMTQKEIAEKSGEPLGTIKTRVRLGMQKLRGLLIDDK